MLTPELTGQRQNDSGNLLPNNRLAIFLQFLRTNGFHKSVRSQYFVRVSQSKGTPPLPNIRQ